MLKALFWFGFAGTMFAGGMVVDALVDYFAGCMPSACW